MKPNLVYLLEYRTRDIGYGVESALIRAYWTGEIDTWGKYKIRPTDGGDTLFLFEDEIISFRDNKEGDPQ